MGNALSLSSTRLNVGNLCGALSKSTLFILAVEKFLRSFAGRILVAGPEVDGGVDGQVCDGDAVGRLAAPGRASCLLKIPHPLLD
jgi:hypothetical protein